MEEDEAIKSTELLSYKVTSPITLSSVAAMHGTTPQRIAHLNRITSTYVFPGQTLIIRKPYSPIEETHKVRQSDNHAVRHSTHIKDPILFETRARHITSDLGCAAGNLIVTVNNMYFDAELNDVHALTHGVEIFHIGEAVSNLVSLSSFSKLPEGVITSSHNDIASPTFDPRAELIYIRLRFMGTDSAKANEFWLEIGLTIGFEFQRHLLLSTNSSTSVDVAKSLKTIRVDSKTSSLYKNESLISDWYYTDVVSASSFEKAQINKIFVHVPPRVCCEDWKVIFSTQNDGYSLMRLIRAYGECESPSLIVIQDTHNKIFGIYLSHPLRQSKSFYGTGETYLFSFHPTFRIFRWSGGNDYFIKCSNDELIFGMSDGFYGLWIDNDLCNGTTIPCRTFDSQCLTVSSDFLIKNLEVWSFSARGDYS